MHVFSGKLSGIILSSYVAEESLLRHCSSQVDSFHFLSNVVAQYTSLSVKSFSKRIHTKSTTKF